MDDAWREARHKLLDELRRSGIRDERVLAELERIPRERFVPEAVRERAYWNRALPTEGGQTISQPFVVARMTELLETRPGMRVLEIGTGTGYQTALLLRLGCEVFSVERDGALTRGAEARLAALGLGPVQLHVGDGTVGWSEHGPYDGILVTAGAPSVPPPLLGQLAEGGRLVIPVGDREAQTMEIVTRVDGRLQRSQSFGCRFVPLRARTAGDFLLDACGTTQVGLVLGGRDHPSPTPVACSRRSNPCRNRSIAGATPPPFPKSRFVFATWCRRPAYWRSVRY